MKYDCFIRFNDFQQESDRKLVNALGNEIPQDHPVCDKEDVINGKTLETHKGKPGASVDTCSLSSDNLLHAGTTLKNTEYVYGVCVYGGAETKVRKVNSVMMSIMVQIFSIFSIQETYFDFFFRWR